MKITAGLLILILTACGVRVPANGAAGDDVYASHAPSNEVDSSTPAASTALRASVVSTAYSDGDPKLVRIYFNPYTDSIKPVLNYYINVEGEFSDGTFLPLDTKYIKLWSDVGTVEGNEWLIKPPVNWKKVTFYAEALGNSALKASLTQYVKQGRSEEDERILKGRQSNGRD